jgi:hypothetical protein
LTWTCKSLITLLQGPLSITNFWRPWKRREPMVCKDLRFYFSCILIVCHRASWGILENEMFAGDLFSKLPALCFFLWYSEGTLWIPIGYHRIF